MGNESISTRKRLTNPVPAEGENGLFTQSWFPVAWTTDVPKGKVIGRDFLDGRIVVFRGENGRLVAASAYCAHVGADLSVGEVIGNNLRCAFHHWQYDQDARCVKTGLGVPPPKDACLFLFPVQERYGIIWVFNGETPLFDLPEAPYPDDELEVGIAYEPKLINIDPWVFAANTPDMQHIKVVHKVNFDGEDPHSLVKWHKYGFGYTYRGLDQGNVWTEYTLGIQGTSVFFRFGNYEDFWRGSVAGFGLPKPGWLVMYSVNLVQKGPKAKERLETATFLSRRTLSEDKPIMDTLHYRPGYLIKGDQSLSRFLSFVRNFPRAHPSADFIR
jgi:phenylpropionate dioxygenase-like ring-hydroxylating dioxygenase large terminal subunit